MPTRAPYSTIVPAAAVRSHRPVWPDPLARLHSASAKAPAPAKPLTIPARETVSMSAAAVTMAPTAETHPPETTFSMTSRSFAREPRPPPDCRSTIIQRAARLATSPKAA